MVEIEIEIRETHNLSQFAYYEKATQSEAIREMVESAMTPYLEMNPSLKDESYFVTPSKEWKKLPKNLYLVYETDSSPGYSVYRLRRKKNACPTAEVLTISLTFSLEASLDQEPILIRYLYD